jgi:hypothetical protein
MAHQFLRVLLKAAEPAILPSTVDVKALGTLECTAERLRVLSGMLQSRRDMDAIQAVPGVERDE